MVQHPVSPPADRPLTAFAGQIIRRNGAHTTHFISSTFPALRVRALVQCTHSQRGNANKEPASAAQCPLVLPIRFVEVLSHASAQRASTAGQDTGRAKH